MMVLDKETGKMYRLLSTAWLQGTVTVRWAETFAIETIDAKRHLQNMDVAK